MENCCRFVFYNNMEKVQAEVTIFVVENARVKFLLSVLLQTIATSKSARVNFYRYCKNRLSACTEHLLR